MKSHLIEQIKTRRQSLGLRQSDMELRIGISRQQYQRLESKGNPRLDTLELIASGLNSELLLIPKDKLYAVRALLAEQTSTEAKNLEVRENPPTKPLSEDPWQGLLEDTDE